MMTHSPQVEACLVNLFESFSSVRDITSQRQEEDNFAGKNDEAFLRIKTAASGVTCMHSMFQTHFAFSSSLVNCDGKI